MSWRGCAGAASGRARKPWRNCNRRRRTRRSSATQARPRNTNPPPNARRGASAYTLIETAKLNGVDPRAWIADTLNRIQDYKTNRIHKLMPWNWKRKTPP